MLFQRIRFASYLLIGLFVILCLRIWQLQILEGNKYRRLAEDNRLRVLKTQAPRGIIYDRKGTPLVQNIPTFSVSLIPEDISAIDSEALSTLLGIKKEDLEEKLNRKDNSPFVPVRLKGGLTYQEVARIEARRSDFPGLSVETEVGRSYPFGKVGAHVIGYLGKVTPAQQNSPELRGLGPDMLVGQWGVEALFDDQLRGSPGEKILEVDALGRELRLIQQRQPINGKDVSLTIDIAIQKAVEDAFGDKAGALVAIEPNSGEILALESLPSFDPNVFSRGLTYQEWKAFIDDKKKPMLNRVLQSQYPPGSTFKIITAVAALEEGLISPETKFFCRGGLSFGKWTFGCWKKGGHGLVDFHRGLVESCDVYFYELGRRVGIDRIFKYATALGLGKETGVRLVKERGGLIPTAQWKKDNKGIPWYLGDTFMSAIGQGFVSVTPMQMATMMATFSNGGRLYRPSLIKENHASSEAATLKPETMSLIKSALSGVVNEGNGTAARARSSMVTIGGKTGTAQVAGKNKGLVGERFMDHAWFVAFAPVAAPDIALAVFVEHGGHGGAVAAPIAKKAIEAYVTSQKERVSSGPPQDKRSGETPAPVKTGFRGPGRQGEGNVQN